MFLSIWFIFLQISRNRTETPVIFYLGQLSINLFILRKVNNIKKNVTHLSSSEIVTVEMCIIVLFINIVSHLDVTFEICWTPLVSQQHCCSYDSCTALIFYLLVIIQCFDVTSVYCNLRQLDISIMFTF